MDAPSATAVDQFGQFHLDLHGGGLTRCAGSGDRLSVSVGSRALDVLGALVQRHGELVSKDEIMAVEWRGAVVEEANLSVQISSLRRTLDAGTTGSSCIQTVPGRGYRFTAPVTRLAKPAWPPALPESSGAFPVGANAADAPRPRRRGMRGIAAAFAGVAAVVLAAGGGWMLHEGPAPRPAAYSPQDRRYAVVVLPFENSSGDPAQDAVAAGITRDATDRIASDPALPLIPPSAFSGEPRKPLDPLKVGRDKDAHFAPTGNARPQDGRLIVAAILYQISDARPVWSQRFDEPDDADGRNIILQHIYENFWQTTIDVEAARALREHPDRLDKRDLMAVAMSSALAQPSRANIANRLAAIDQALAIDPNYPLALEYKARVLAARVLNGFSLDEHADLKVALAAADRMLVVAPNDYYVALKAKAAVLRALGRWDEAAPIARRLTELSPLESNRHTEYGLVLMAQGHYAQALDHYMTARKFAAAGDNVGLIDAYIAVALVANDRFPEAIAQARLAIPEVPPESGRVAEYPWLALVAAESENGQNAEAHADLQRFGSMPRIGATMADVRTFPYLAANSKLLDGLQYTALACQNDDSIWLLRLTGGTPKRNITRAQKQSASSWNQYGVDMDRLLSRRLGNLLGPVMGHRVAVDVEVGKKDWLGKIDGALCQPLHERLLVEVDGEMMQAPRRPHPERRQPRAFPGLARRLADFEDIERRHQIRTTVGEGV